jgi:hypothetical protein
LQDAVPAILNIDQGTIRVRPEPLTHRNIYSIVQGAINKTLPGACYLYLMLPHIDRAYMNSEPGENGRAKSLADIHYTL